MKRILLLFLFTILSTASFAQFRAGCKLTLSGNDLKLNPDSASVRLQMIRLNGGLIASYRFTNLFSLQTELLYSSLCKNYSVESAPYKNRYGDEITKTTDVKIRLEYLEMPLLAKFTLFSSQKVTFDLAIGPFISYKLSARQQTDGNDFQNKTSDYSTFNAGYNLSVGFSVLKKRLFFEMGGSRGLVNINTASEIKIHTFQGGLAVGYYLFNGTQKQ